MFLRGASWHRPEEHPGLESLAHIGRQTHALLTNTTLIKQSSFRHSPSLLIKDLQIVDAVRMGPFGMISASKRELRFVGFYCLAVSGLLFHRNFFHRFCFCICGHCWRQFNRLYL